jgi:hypothetical protein
LSPDAGDHLHSAVDHDLDGGLRAKLSSDIRITQPYPSFKNCSTSRTSSSTVCEIHAIRFGNLFCQRSPLHQVTGAVPMHVPWGRVVMNMGVAPASSTKRTNSNAPGTAPDLGCVTPGPFQEVCSSKARCSGLYTSCLQDRNSCWSTNVYSLVTRPSRSSRKSVPV